MGCIVMSPPVLARGVAVRGGNRQRARGVSRPFDYVSRGCEARRLTPAFGTVFGTNVVRITSAKIDRRSGVDAKSLGTRVRTAAAASASVASVPLALVRKMLPRECLWMLPVCTSNYQTAIDARGHSTTRAWSLNAKDRATKSRRVVVNIHVMARCGSCAEGTR